MGGVSKRKLAVIPGASSGIGFELARQSAAHGSDLVCAEDTGLQSATLALSPDGRVIVTPVQADLSRLEGGVLNEVLPETTKARQAGRHAEPDPGRKE